MNVIVETINSAGRAFIDFAVPMLIQSTVLILILILVDVIVRRKVRAVFRYWIWMLVLVKLVLPPSLWSPVSIGGWFGEKLEVPTAALLEPEGPQRAEPWRRRQPSTADNILSQPTPAVVGSRGPVMQGPAAELPPLPTGEAEYGDADPQVKREPVEASQPKPAVASPSPVVSWQGLIFLIWAGVAVALSLLLLQRALFVRGLVAQADSPNRSVRDVLDDCLERMGLGRRIALRVSPNATSPAVCGLVRPVILVPRNLAPKLSPRNLRVVLLHELAHIERGDLWVNLAQTLLQIVYFYNPLLWLANAVIRRVREQAVDETVLVAMGERACDYPDTLISVARLAFRRRPALSLRLIGVVESRSALTARIKHILNRPIPKSARLGLVGLLAVVIVAAVVLPMAKASGREPSEVNEGPLDIRFVGTCPDQGADILDADGEKMASMPYPLAGSPAWKPDTLRRDFIFELPETEEPTLFLNWRLIKVAGSDIRLHQTNANPIFPIEVSGRKLVFLDARLPRVYQKRTFGLFNRKVLLQKVDVILRYFYGPPRETRLSFAGPFAEGQVLAARENSRAKLTVLPEKDEGAQGERLAYFGLDVPFDMDAYSPILVYDTAGKRHLAWPGSVSRNGGRTSIEFHCPWGALSLSEVARIAVERPYEVTVKNVRVDYRGRPARGHAEYLDLMARRLGRTNVTPEYLANHRIEDANEAIAVMDVVQGAHHGRQVFEAIRHGQPRVSIAVLDQPTQEKVRTVARKWSETGLLSGYGIGLGLFGQWPEFVDLAIGKLERDYPEYGTVPSYARSLTDSKRDVARHLMDYGGPLSPEQIERVERLILQADDYGTKKYLMYCLFRAKSPAAEEAIWELADDDRPWIWWQAAWFCNHMATDGDGASDHLPEKLKLRMSLAKAVGDDAELEANLHDMLVESLTPDMYYMARDNWQQARDKISRGLERATATQAFIRFLRMMQADLSRDRWTLGSVSHAAYPVCSVVRNLNLWYGVNLGNQGVEAGADAWNVEPKSVGQIRDVIAEVLAWRAGSEGLEPRDLPFEGRVVDTRGQGIDGAVLTFTRREDYINERGGESQRTVDVGQCRTDAEGRFAFGALSKHPYYLLDVTADGFAPRKALHVGQLPDRRYRYADDDTIELQHPGRISGNAIAQDGKPLTGTRLRCFSSDFYSADQHRDVETDEHGGFVLDDVSSGYHVLTYHEGTSVRVGNHWRSQYGGICAAAVVHLDEGQRSEKVLLDLAKSTCSLEVEVVDAADNPVKAATIWLQVKIPSGQYKSGDVFTVYHTSPEGLYRFDHLPPIEGYVLLRSDSLDFSEKVEVTLVPGETARCRVRLRGLVARDNPGMLTGPLDSDGDGLSDFQEVHKYLTDPATKDSDGDGTQDGDWSERREYTYSVRTVLRYMPPFNEDALNDDFQDARVLKQTDAYIEMEVIHYPLATAHEGVGANRNWKRDDAHMAEYLAPGVTANWDEQMKQDLLAELKADGIDVSALTDKEVVEQVSAWLMKRSRSLDKVFTTFYVWYPDGRPRVYPGLEGAFQREFERDSENYDWTIEEHFDHELLGKGMFYNRTHGSCTSVAVYLTTALRALGIPTRMVLVTPAVDAADREQILMVKDTITHNRVRETMLTGLRRSSGGFTNHTFNEVYVGDRWVRLDYTTLGCPILGVHRFGLQTHLYTFNDLSDANLVPTWGVRYAKGQRDDIFKHSNPYSAVEISDLFGPHGNVPNPPFSAREVSSGSLPDIFIMEPARTSGSEFSIWDEVLSLVKDGTYNKTGRAHEKESYDNIFEGVWTTKPGDVIVLLFSLDTQDRIPEGYEDLLPKPWPQIESSLKRGERVELGTRAREMNIILLAAPVRAELQPLIQTSKLLRALGGSMAPEIAPAPGPGPAPASSIPVVRFDNGVGMQLLGLCEHPSEGRRWWRPDGSLLETAPYKTTGSRITHQEDRKEYEFALRLSGPGGTEVKWLIPGSTRGSDTGQGLDEGGNRLQDVYAYTANQPEDAVLANVFLGVAGGEWRSCAVHSRLGQEGSYSLKDKEGGAVAFGVAYAKEGDTYVPVTTNFDSRRTDYRVLAVDEQGTVHVGNRSGYGGNVLSSMTCRFALPLSQVKELRFQTRPRQWVEFRNVSLRPGRRTDVRIEFPNAETVMARSQRAAGSEKAIGIGPAWETLKEMVGRHYGGSIGGYSKDEAPWAERFEQALSRTQPGDTFVMMFAFDKSTAVPRQYLDLLPLPWSAIKSRVGRGELVELQGRARGLNVVVLAAPTLEQLGTLVRQTRLLEAFGDSVRSGDVSAEKTLAEPVQLGPPVERVLALDGTWIDFERGVTPGPPSEAEPGDTAEALRQWCREQGIDAVADTATGRLNCLDAELVKLDRDAWTAPSVERLRQALDGDERIASSNIGGLPAVSLGATDQAPSTYGLRTREGTLGLLQIVDASAQGEGQLAFVKIRYRLAVAEIAESAAPVQRELSLGRRQYLDLDSGRFVGIAPGEAADPKILIARGVDLYLTVEPVTANGPPTAQIKSLQMESADAPARLYLQQVSADNVRESLRAAVRQLDRPKPVTFYVAGGTYAFRTAEGTAGVLRGTWPNTDEPPRCTLRYRLMSELDIPSAEFPWGAPTEGLQCRLRKQTNAWRAGETPTLSLDLRNQGEAAFSFIRVAEAQCELEVDGAWYGWAEPLLISAPVWSLEPGTELNDAIGIQLTDSWALPAEGAPLTFAPGIASHWGKRLELAPGNHTVRVGFHASESRLSPDAQGRSAVSNPVEIAVLSSEESPSAGTVTSESDRAPGTQVRKERVYLPDLETPNAKVVLDLRTGELLSAEPMENDQQYFEKLGKGDIVYEHVSGKSGLLCLRGATMKRRTENGLQTLAPDVTREYFVLYFVQEVPVHYQITTAEGDKYELTVLSIDKGDGGGVLVEFRKTDDSPGGAGAGRGADSWRDLGATIPPDANDTRTLAPHVTLDGIGQDVERKAFISCLRDIAETRDRQYRFVLVTKEGQTLEPTYYTAQERDGGDTLWEKFSFAMPFHRRQIAHLRLQSRLAAGAGQVAPSPRGEILARAGAEKQPVSSLQAPPGRYALSFDGKDDYLFIPDSPSLQMNTPFFIEMWMKPDIGVEANEPGPGQGLLAKGCYTSTGRASVEGYAIRLARWQSRPSTLFLEHSVGTDRGIVSASVGTTLTEDWMHVCGAFTYRDAGDVSAPGHPLVVSSFLIPTENPFKGQIGEIRIWNDTVIRSDLRQYRADIRRYGNAALTGNEPGLVACWTFEQTAGQIAYDISPNGNHARLGSSVDADDADPTWIDLIVEGNQADGDLQGISGVVVDPNGDQVAGAQVALCTKEKGVTIVTPRLLPTDFRDKTSDIVETDAEGRFSFPRAAGEFLIIAAHERGFARVKGDDLTASTTVRLERWGQVEGTLYIAREPGDGRALHLFADLGGGRVPWPWVRYDHQTTAKAGGRFVFRQVVPAWMRIGYYARMADGSSGHPQERPICVIPGEIVEIAIGGTGRPVVGRLALSPDVAVPAGATWGPNVMSTARPEIPKPAGYDRMTPLERKQWRRQWAGTPEGRAYYDALHHDVNRRSYGLPIRKDGAFRIEDVIPGKYELRVRLWETSGPLVGVETIGPYVATVEVPPIPQAYTAEPLDLGTITLTGQFAEGSSPAPRGEAVTKGGRPAQGAEQTSSEVFGRVLDPDGNPVAGAQVALSTNETGVLIEDGELSLPGSGDAEKGEIADTDAEGRFRFENEASGDFSVIAAHEAGFALVRSDVFLKDREIQLEKWGRIEGRLAEGRKALENQIWMAGLPNETWLKHKRQYRYETQCDAEGRFVFEKAPAGRFEVGYLTRTGESWSSITSRTPVEVTAGATAKVQLGGEGRPVVGRFVPPADYDGPLYFGAGSRSLVTTRPQEPRPEDYDQMTRREQQQWHRQWRETPEAQAFYEAMWRNPDWRYYVFHIKEDGSFRIEDVIEGKYDMMVDLEDRLTGQGPPEEIGGYYGTIDVPEVPGGYADEPLDLGELTLKMRRPLHVGDEAPPFEAKTLAGEDIRLVDYRGKYVLLSFWHPASTPELARLKELHEAYGRTGRFQIIGLGGSDTLDEVKKYIDEHQIEWPQVYFGQAWGAGIAAQYGLPGLPYILLIDPQGKIVATWLRGEKLTTAVREALGKID